MGSCILKFETKRGPRYLVYSSICDAPVTYGMTLAEFKKFYKKEHGEQGMKDLPARLERVEKTGSSGYEDESLKDAVLVNRAGLGETRMTVDQIRDWYCATPKERAGKKVPVGEWPYPEDEK